MSTRHTSISVRRSGFTLIELLIVIAIILILIAIALPNFLEAQIRAKVANAKGNARTIAIAMEAYIIDFKQYPMDHDPNYDPQKGLYQLTTPLKYLSSIPEEPFAKASGLIDPNAGEVGWEMGSTGQGRRSPSTAFPAPKIHAFGLASFGPDYLDSFPCGDRWTLCSAINVADPCTDDRGAAWTDYNPTNGTKSSGDIMQLGGELNTGNYCVNGWQRVKGRWVLPT
jgi:prepilin-type N-terminal cleavage/methylation domain-containing protein